jgi:hypothetical protein
VINRYDFLYRQASLHFQTASESQKPVYLSKMVDITDRLVSLLGLETLREKQEAEKRAATVDNELAKNEALMEAITKL